MLYDTVLLLSLTLLTVFTIGAFVCGKKSAEQKFLYLVWGGVLCYTWFELGYIKI